MNRKKVLMIVAVVVAVCLVAALLAVMFLGNKNKSADSETASVKIKKSAGQEVVFAQLTAVNGNEITYTVAAAQENSAEGDAQMPEGFENGENPQMPEGLENGEKPQMPEGFENGEKPEMPQMPQDVSGGDQVMGGRGNRGDMSQGRQNTQNSYAFSYDGTSYQLTLESHTALIPVGTEVITKLGTVTTFSRLEVGDNVALVMEQSGEEQVIVAVYIIA